MDQTRKIETACGYIRAHATERISLAELASQAGLSPFHFQRTFKAVIGVTPKKFAESCRLHALKSNLRSGRSVTDAIYETGFGSSSRVYERSDANLGMTPAEYRAGGYGVEISYVTVRTQFGRIMMGATERGVCFVQFGESDHELLEGLKEEYPHAILHAMVRPYPDQFADWIVGLEEHLKGHESNLPLDLRGTAFQMQVWSYLRSIPRGETRSYSAVAAAIGRPKATRAVARACATNRVAVLIPCHRVIRGDGGLGGYRGGIARKRELLEKEST